MALHSSILQVIEEYNLMVVIVIEYSFATLPVASQVEHKIVQLLEE